MLPCKDYEWKSEIMACTPHSLHLYMQLMLIDCSNIHSRQHRCDSVTVSHCCCYTMIKRSRFYGALMFPECRVDGEKISKSEKYYAKRD